MINTIGFVAMGGALGAVLRYGVNVAGMRVLGPDFPWATLTVNVVGSFVMGALAALFAHVWQPAAELRVFLITGFLGAFTTFSAFSLDVITLWERGAMWAAAFYTGGSVALSVAALFAGMMIVRSVAL